jgi:hypothetical protein
MYKLVALIFATVATGTALADTLLLAPHGPAYPALLERSCGGVRTATYLTGFDADGHVVGAVHAWTRCNPGGRGGRTKTYDSWHSLVWDLRGSLLRSERTGPLKPDPRFTATDERGNTISTLYLGPGSNSADYAGVLTTR